MISATTTARRRLKQRLLLRTAILLIAAWSLPPAAGAAPLATRLLDELTWTEVRDALNAGNTTIIIPVGGSEQSGPHMVLGKHNVRAAALSSMIASKLGNALVAPVIAYVPEGNVSPPSGHMRFPGTISVPDAAFAGLLDGAARSLKQHGFTDIVLIGDHGGYQKQMESVARRLNGEWAGSKQRVHYIEAYYRAASIDFAQALRSQGLTSAQIGTHAGVADTSLTLALHPAGVRSGLLHAPGLAGPSSGITGNPEASTAELGRIGVELIVGETVDAVRKAVAAPR